MTRRSWSNRVFWALCWLAFLLIAAPAVAVIVSVFHQALPSLGWSTFTKGTNSVGLQNAILGTLLLLLGVFIVAGIIGVAAGIYLAEFSTPRLGGSLRFFSEVLAGMPSIVIGYIGYIALVVGFHWGFSLLAAVFALSALVLPYIVKTTEVALRAVPSPLREASAALGVSRTKTIGRVLLPPALPGIVSGLIVALAISTGETAPLLFTAGFSDKNPSFSLFHHQIGYLTGVTFTDISLPGARAHATAAAAGAVTLMILIILIALGRIVSARARKATARMAL
ncbi:MAG TPA: phosphate ABC transporter permease PstA [Acidimicrobiales bacterium]|jgi:phosphate transport system permease protein|nr:phosphate ABC transporter permease PstA [Acidimicrobiales bacterium]